MTEQQLPLTQALGFTRPPFDKNIPSKLLFLSQQIKQLFVLLHQFLQRRGIALITGEIGAGKSTAIRAFIEQLESNHYDIAYIADPTIPDASGRHPQFHRHPASSPGRLFQMAITGTTEKHH